MIDTGQRLGVTALLMANQRTLMGTAVDHRIDLAVAILDRDDWCVADEAGAIVTGLLQV